MALAWKYDAPPVAHMHGRGLVIWALTFVRMTFCKLGAGDACKYI
jgi:hypothetical protein